GRRRGGGGDCETSITKINDITTMSTIFCSLFGPIRVCVCNKKIGEKCTERGEEGREGERENGKIEQARKRDLGKIGFWYGVDISLSIYYVSLILSLSRSSPA